MRALRRLLAVTALVLFAPGVQASLIFSFSFDNDPTQGGNTGGPIAGEIHGLADNATGPASKVIIKTIGAHTVFGDTLPFDVISGGWTIELNSNLFEVTNGSVVDWRFNASHSHGAAIPRELIEMGSASSNFAFFDVLFERGQNTTVSPRAPTFLPLNGAVVPEPSTLLLTAVGLLGLQSLRRWRQAAPPR